jgi:hypothetical protein
MGSSERPHPEGCPPSRFSLSMGGFPPLPSIDPRRQPMALSSQCSPHPIVAAPPHWSHCMKSERGQLIILSRSSCCNTHGLPYLQPLTWDTRGLSIRNAHRFPLGIPATFPIEGYLPYFPILLPVCKPPNNDPKVLSLQSLLPHVDSRVPENILDDKY